MQIAGLVSMPKELEVLLQRIGDKSDACPNSNENDYLSSVPRKIDVLLLCVFYGLYSSSELPPQDTEEIKNEGSYDFNVGVASEVEMIRNILLLLWISGGKHPVDLSKVEFRKEAYSFLDKVLDDSYIIKVVFPYYLQKAAESEGDTSFISKLNSSRYVEWRMHPYAPERLALDFVHKRAEFERKLQVAIDAAFTGG